MAVNIPKDVEERVLHLVESGRYIDSGAAMREAVNLLQERDRRIQWLRDAVAIGDAELACGEGIPYTNRLLDEIEEESEARYACGEKPGPDVLP